METVIYREIGPDIQAAVRDVQQAGVEAGFQLGIEAGIEAGVQAGVEAGLPGFKQADFQASVQNGVH